MKSILEIKDRLEQEKETLDGLVNEPYKPGTPQLTNIFCICSSIDALKWVLND